ADLDLRDDLPAGRIDDAHRVEETVTGPELSTVGGDLQHVRAATDEPLRGHPMGRDVDHGDPAGLTVAHVQRAGVAAEGQPVRAPAGRDEADLAHGHRVEEDHPVTALVRDVEERAVGGQTHVHRELGDLRASGDDHLAHVHLDDDAVEFGRRYEV